MSLAAALPFLLHLASLAAQEPQADLQAVLQQVFGHAEFVTYLHPRYYRKVVYRCDEPPVYNNAYVARPTFDVLLPDQRRVSFTNTLEPTQAIINVGQLVVDHDSANVQLRLATEGVVGQFWLGRTAANHWRVVKATVYEI